MTDEQHYYLKVADDTAVHITGSFADWTSFLDFAGRLYKWPFEDQLLIYAQRPDAAACADKTVWNRLGHLIRPDAKPIVLTDYTAAEPLLRYVYDLTDTAKGPNVRPLWLWRYDDREHGRAVLETLGRKYGCSGRADMTERLEETAGKLARDYWKYHREEILETVQGSYLEEYDEFNVKTAFLNAASASIAYALMSRCGLAQDSDFERRDFERVFEFNTPKTASILGRGVSESAKEALLTIESAVKQYERQKRAERPDQNRFRQNRRRGIPKGRTAAVR